jgi:uncharacterized protein DUF302
MRRRELLKAAAVVLGAGYASKARARSAIQYDIGNPLTASRMTEHQLSAALYAPIRVLLRESPEEGVVAFEYDRPARFSDSSTMPMDPHPQPLPTRE